MSTTSQDFVLSEHIRMPTEPEIEFFRENGWAFLPQLVSRPLAAELLRRIKKIVQFDYDEVPPDALPEKATVVTENFALNAMPRLQDDFLRSYVESHELGEAAAMLTGIRPMRVVTDSVIYKLPEWTGHGGDTDWHQDLPNVPVEPKTGCMQTWLALCDITEDMGGMQHLSGSHKEGPLLESNDSMNNQWSLEEFLELFPVMKKYPMSEPHTYAPGDALVHDGLCAHGAFPNRSNRVRWAYTSYRMPATTKYVGRPYSPWLDSLELEIGKPLDHPLLPVVSD